MQFFVTGDINLKMLREWLYLMCTHFAVACDIPHYTCISYDLHVSKIIALQSHERYVTSLRWDKYPLRKLLHMKVAALQQSMFYVVYTQQLSLLKSFLGKVRVCRQEINNSRQLILYRHTCKEWIIVFTQFCQIFTYGLPVERYWTYIAVRTGLLPSRLRHRTNW